MPDIKPDKNYGQGTGFSVQSIMVRDAAGIVRALTQHDTIPACIKNVLASSGGGGGGGGGGTPQSLSITSTTGTSPQYISISGGNTVTIRTPLKTTALIPAATSVGAVSTRVYGNLDGTLGRPDAWIQIDGTNLVLPAFAGL